jgi:hypothetical protein
MIALPHHPSTPALAAFGIVGIGLGCLAIFLTHLLVMASLFWLVAAAAWIAGLSAIVRWRWLWLKKPYLIYNRILQIAVNRVIRPWVLAAAFGTVILANRPFGKRLRRGKSDGRVLYWHTKEILEVIGGNGDGDVVVDEEPEAGWLSGLLRWIRRTGNGWVVALLPFMLTLRLLDEGEVKTSVSADTYTLY